VVKLAAQKDERDEETDGEDNDDFDGEFWGQ
jgi:hypothetical protein